MANYTLTPNMSLLQPSIGVEGWQAAAGELNTSLSLVDGHDHSNGRGVAIGTAGLNIQGDLALNGNNLTTIRALRMSALSLGTLSASDNAALATSGVDLYYRDGNGNNIRLTQSGSIVGTAGSISGLNSPASASYVSGSGTFIWQSAASTSASMDMGSITLRPMTSGANGVTIAPPSGLGASYALTLPPAPPGTGNALTLTSTAGNQTYLTLGTANQVLAVNGAGTALTYSLIGTSNIATGAVTGSTVASGTITGTNLASATITSDKLSQTVQAGSTFSAVNLSGATGTIFTSGTFTASGNVPTKIIIQGNGSESYIQTSFSSGQGTNGTIILTLDGNPVSVWRFNCSASSGLAFGLTQSWPQSLVYIPPTNLTAGTHTYQVSAQITAVGSTSGLTMHVSGGDVIIVEI
jgi:hypothetical protein